jgi:dihydroorotase
MPETESLLIKNGRVVDPASGVDEILDVLITNGKIDTIKAGIESSAAVELDASGKIVAPGFIDMHIHLREPGQEHKEDIESGTAAAAAGGFTSVACMPNTNPVIDNSGIVDLIMSRADSVGVVNVFPIGAATQEMKGADLSNVGELVSAGVVAISDDAFPIQNNYLLRKVLEYTNMFDICFISHPEDKDLSAGGVMNEGFYSTELGLKGIPAAAEEIMVSRNIFLSRLTDTPVHMAHISSKGSVRMIADAKEEGLKITAETAPHYFTLTDACLQTYDTNLKMDPPLRSDEDCKAIIEALRDGTLDALASDHAPHQGEEKLVEFNYAPFGIIGLETMVGVSFNELYHKEKFELSRLIELYTTKPAAILRLDKGTLKPGADADVTIIDLDREWEIDASKFKSKSRNTPFDKWRVKGKAVATIVGGKVVYEDK